MGKKDYINNTKFHKTTIQNKISYDLGKKSECDKADVSRQKIKDIRNCSHYLAPTPSLYPPPPKKKKKKIYGLNIKQVIQIEMVRQTRRMFTTASVLGVCELERSLLQIVEDSSHGSTKFQLE